MPERIAALRLRVTSAAGARDDPGVRRAALGDVAVVIDQPGLEGARLRRRLLAQNVRQQRDRLDVAARQRMSGWVMTATPASSSAGRRLLPLGRRHQRRRRLRRELVVARGARRGSPADRPCRAATPLRAISSRSTSRSAGARHRPGDAQLAQRIVRAGRDAVPRRSAGRHGPGSPHRRRRRTDSRGPRYGRCACACGT